MTAPNLTVGKYELYRVVLDYEALVDGFLDRIYDLDTTLSLPSFADGQAQKLLTKEPGKMRSDRPTTPSRRTFGWESLGKMLDDTGLALVLVVDDERFATVKEQLTKRRRRPERAFARSKRPAWLFRKKKAREMGKRRWSGKTEQQRKKAARKAGRASGRARRRRARQKSNAGALLRPAIAASSAHGQSPPNA